MSQDQQPVIPPVDTALLKAELTSDNQLRSSNKGGNIIYTFDGRSCPNLMREVGRLREITFRGAGGGSGKDCDIDAFDLMDPPCRQLIVWDPENEMIIGGYRYIIGPDIRLNPEGSPRLATSHLFRFSESFIRDYLPYTIELGRSFVRTEYQSSRAGAKAIFALDNLWDGLGALTVIHPEMRYLFGKVTMYPEYSAKCRNMILYFINPLQTDIDVHEMRHLFHGATFAEDYRILNHAIRENGLNIPPLVNAYMSLSPTMKMFGTAVNDEFGDVEESGIFLDISEILEEKKKRHIDTFLNLRH